MFRPGHKYQLSSISVIPLVERSPHTAEFDESEPFKKEKPEALHRWSTEPRVIKKSLTGTILNALTDIVFFLLSLTFLVFGFTVRAYSQAPVSEHTSLTNGLLKATYYGPTIFPILFAAVVGRAIKATLFWRLEHGERLGLLDLLAGSTTLVSTVTTQIIMRYFSPTGPLLILLWALSPIGGQASLRVMTVGNATTTAASEYQYMMQNRTFEPFVTADDASQIAVINGLFVASLLSPWATKHSPVDTWNNPKIPMIEAMEAARDADDNEGWYLTQTGTPVYASLIGTPISNLSSGAVNGSLIIETSYWFLDCPILESEPQPPGVNISAGDWSSWMGDSAVIASNASLHRAMNATTLPPRVIVYNDWDPNEEQQSGSQCLITTTYVEVQLDCLGSSCTASRIRRSQLPHPVPEWTFLDDVYGRVWSYFGGMFVNTISGHSATASAVQVYFIDPVRPFDPENNSTLSSLHKDVYAQRFAQLLNTLWSAIVGMYAIPEGLTETTATDNETTLEISYEARYAITNGTWTAHIPVIQCHDGWLIALTISSLAMITAALAHPVIRLFTKAPEMALNVSTLGKDSPYLGLPAGNSGLDADKRARLAKNVKVRFGDVKSEAEVGHLAVGGISAEQPVVRIRKGRAYD